MMKIQNSTAMNFKADGLDFRRYKEVVGRSVTLTYFVYDPTASDTLCSAPLIAEYNTDGNLVAKYHHDGGLIAMTRGNASYWHAFEAIGTVRQLTDTQSQVPDSYFYDAWGNELTSPHSQIPNPFRYVGKHGYYLDTQSALMLLGVRYYGANMGRFLSLDPIASGLNWCTYTHNPLRWIDPKGQQIPPYIPPYPPYPPPPPGAPTGDSDRDGIPDCYDPYPYDKDNDPSNGEDPGPQGPPPPPPSPPPVHNTQFEIDPQCNRSCPQLGIALNLAVQWIRSRRECTFQYNRVCQAISPEDQPREYCVSIPTVGRVNCGGRRPDRVTLTCRDLGEGIDAQAPGCGRIEINTRHRGCNDLRNVDYLARTIIHEMAHNCFWCGGRPYQPQPRSWQCPFGCGRRWDPPRPVDVIWEACAELLAHECSGRRDL